MLKEKKRKSRPLPETRVSGSKKARNIPGERRNYWNLSAQSGLSNFTVRNSQQLHSVSLVADLVINRLLELVSVEGCDVLQQDPLPLLVLPAGNVHVEDRDHNIQVIPVNQLGIFDLTTKTKYSDLST